jgi:hypothetical protein
MRSTSTATVNRSAEIPAKRTIFSSLDKDRSPEWSHDPALYQLVVHAPPIYVCRTSVSGPNVMARQKGLEPLTHGLEGRCSVHLSYWRNRGEPI